MNLRLLIDGGWLSNWALTRRRSDNSGWTGSLFNFYVVIFHVVNFYLAIFQEVDFHLAIFQKVDFDLVNSQKVDFREVNFHIVFDIDIKNSYIERKISKMVYIMKLCKLIFDIRNHFSYIEENHGKSFDIQLFFSISKELCYVNR